MPSKTAAHGSASALTGRGGCFATGPMADPPIETRPDVIQGAVVGPKAAPDAGRTEAECIGVAGSRT